MMPESSGDSHDDWESHWTDFYDASQLNPAGAYRVRIVLRWLRRELRPGSRLIDIGSGPGDLVAAASSRFPSTAVRGIELSRTAIAIAQRRAPRAEFVHCDLGGLGRLGGCRGVLRGP